MKPSLSLTKIFGALVFTMCLLNAVTFIGRAQMLDAGFAQPPEETKPWCYWYWISDNISKEGLTRDLEAMARVGIGEAFIGNIFLEDVPAGPVKVLTPAWWELVEHAIREGGRVGVNIGLFNCPGWSQSGGPWIQNTETMRYLASSEARVRGPVRFSGKLPTPQPAFQDVALLAFPAPDHDHDSLASHHPRVVCTPTVAEPSKLIDGDLATAVSFPGNAGRGTNAFTLEFELTEPFTARSLQIVPTAEAFGATCELQAALPDGGYRSVRRFLCDRSNMSLGVGFMPRGPVTIAFPAVTANRFRLQFTGVFTGGQPALAEINLSGAARLESFVEKQLGKMHPTPLPLWDTYLWPTQAEPNQATLTTSPKEVRDLSGQLAANGTLTWEVPAGDWIIQRIGMTPTGMKNSPASPEGQGLEVDKMNRVLAQRHFDAFIGQLLKRMPAADRKALKHVVADSYEMGSQNWTDGFETQFLQRYGYDPKPWLPVLSGRLVASADQSERFLWDLRRLVADRVATEYVGGLREACRAQGLGLWLENYGHWGFPSEFLKYGSESDRIGGEFWVTGDLGSIELRAASSCANTYGRKFVSAESFTGGPAYRNAPGALKARGDWSFCEGVNHVVLHVNIHQPTEDKVPGLNAWFGTEFDRHNTWFERSKAWIDYERRCCWMLQQGHRVADVAYFIGEDAPKMTGVRKPDLPPGRDFDYINAEVIESRLAVRNGLLSLPNGPTYRVLVLPDLDTMRPAVLRKIRDLVRDGATVIGRPPLRSPSLESYPQCDTAVRELASELWGNADTKQSGERWFGRGRIVWGRTLEDVLANLRSPTDFESSIPLRFTHRRDGESDIYFVANPKAVSVTTTAGFRVGDRAPEFWWADSGRTERPAVYDIVDGRVRMPLSLGPQASVFVVFRDRAGAKSERVVSVSADGHPLMGAQASPQSASADSAAQGRPIIITKAGENLELRAAQPGTYSLGFADGSLREVTVANVTAPQPVDGPWEVAFTAGWGAPERVTFDSLVDWTQRPEEGIRHYAGKATYRKTIDLTAPAAGASPERVVLDLGNVRDLATVRVNGTEFTTLWLPPWSVDITSAVKPGENTIEVEVINVWNNRLVGDAGLPAAQRRTSLATPTVNATTPLMPAGLLGPVQVSRTGVARLSPPPRSAKPTARGYPSRDPGLDVLPGFKNPPPGYGEVPFWWWTGDPLDVDRLTWQLDQLHQKGISGVQVNYAHEDSPGWPTYAAQPPLFSDAWWQVWGRVADECRKRDMGIGLSTYTLDWPRSTNLFRQLFYAKTELNALELNSPRRQRLHGGETAAIPVPDNLVGARAYQANGAALKPGSVDLAPFIRDGAIRWTAPESGDWDVFTFTTTRQPNTINPLLAGVGEIVVRDFYQRFQDATPNRSPEGLNYFFNDELNIGAGTHVWNSDFASEFKARKGYDLFEILPALWTDMGSVTPKARMDYADVRMALMEERWFQPIYNWHASRGLIFACDAGGRGLQPDEFGDYFRATRWYTAPGHDTPGGNADLIKGKVSSSIANLYRRPRVWLEGYHSLGWGATPERLMFATRENFLYGCTLLNLHGLYYTTHGSFWEWAPPCYHFRMPYWDHMGVFLKYFERLSYLLSQGAFVSDVAVLYPVAPFEAGLDGGKATKAAFETARALMSAGINFEFIDADSLARATIRNGRLEAADSSYRALIIPAMDAVRWSSLEKARDFADASGLVLSVGSLPFASDRAGRDDATLNQLVAAIFPPQNQLATPADVPARIRSSFTLDTRSDKPVRSLHRKAGPRDIYMVMDAAKGSAVEFRTHGRPEVWDPWTGETRPARVLGRTETGTKVEMPLEIYEAQLIVFSPGEPSVVESPSPTVTSTTVPLEGDWEFELKPTMDNRFGDFRLPAKQATIGPEARLFRHAVETVDAVAWAEPGFNDSQWERVTYGFGPQFWILGPIPEEASSTELAALTRIDPQTPVTVAGKPYAWRPYSFSWRQGLEGDPGHQGWHGLKENVSDHFVCLGRRADALNEIKYEPEPGGRHYYLWTSATVPDTTTARLLTSTRQDGVKPHASEVLTPAAVFLNGARVTDPGQPLALRAGSNPLLVHYDHAGRGYVVLKREGMGAPPSQRTPLAMTWFDDPSVIRFDAHAGAQPAEWFRFVAPPGFRGCAVTADGSVRAWANGQPLPEVASGQFQAAAPFPRGAVVALRVVPRIGSSGAASLPEPVRLDCAPGVTTMGDWSKQGALECYSGGAWYRKRLSLTAEKARGSVILDLGKVVATAEVRVNGQTAGIRVAPPWQVDISKHVKPGENQIEVLVYNTLANHYVTVPTRYRGETTSGLIGPVALQLRPSQP